MDRRNFLAIVITLCLLITCGSKEQSAPVTVGTTGTTEGWLLIGDKEGCKLYYRCVDIGIGCQSVYWSVCEGSTSSVTVH